MVGYAKVQGPDDVDHELGATMILQHNNRTRAPIKTILTGANGGFGRTFLAQLASTPEIRASVLVDPDVAGTHQMLTELGVAAENISQPSSIDETRQAVASSKIALAPTGDLVDWSQVDVLVEACGKVPQGIAYSLAALDAGTHVVMVSKETDTVAGVALARRAQAANLCYLAGDGDQPANLLRLLDWVSAVGLDVVAAGKSGEYDLVLDPTTGEVTQAGVQIQAPELSDLLTLGDDIGETLAARAAAVSNLKRSAAADPCEMTVVALRTGLVADVETMHYPVARIDELADIYAAREDGGIVGGDGVVDVFSALRLPGEASFAGGVFAVVRTGDDVTWELLRGKGHVISKDGRYACIYWPYHYMGVETPLTIYAAMDGLTGPAPRPTTLLAARASTDLPIDTVLRVAGHHHEIAGVAPAMVGPDAEGLPYYVLDGVKLTRPVAAGQLIAIDDVSGVDPQTLELFNESYGRTSSLGGAKTREVQEETGR